MLVREFQDPVGQGRGEQHPQPCLRARHVPHEVTDVLDETQVEHPVGLVEDHHLDPTETEDMLLEIVDQAPGGADQDVHPGGQGLALLLIAGTAEHQSDAKAGVSGQQQGILVDLHGQFTGGRHDQGARLRRVIGRRRLGGEQALQGHQEEGGGLTGTRLGLPRDILTGQGDRQGRGLNRGTVGEAGIGEPLEDAHIEVELVETGGGQVFFCH